MKIDQGPPRSAGLIHEFTSFSTIYAFNYTIFFGTKLLPLKVFSNKFLDLF